MIQVMLAAGSLKSRTEEGCSKPLSLLCSPLCRRFGTRNDHRGAHVHTAGPVLAAQSTPEVNAPFGGGLLAIETDAMLAAPSSLLLQEPWQIPVLCKTPSNAPPGHHNNLEPCGTGM